MFAFREQREQFLLATVTFIVTFSRRNFSGTAVALCAVAVVNRLMRERQWCVPVSTENIDHRALFEAYTLSESVGACALACVGESASE